MAGTWSETNKSSLPGFYNRFKTIGQNRIEMGANGTMAMPVKADWGPVKEFITVTSESELIKAFGNQEGEKITAYTLGRLALLGQPKELLLYRLVDGSEKVSTVTIADANTPTKNLLKIDSKYPTERQFSITIKENAVDSTKKDFLIFEGSVQLLNITGLSGTIKEIATAINSDEANEYVTVSAVEGATGTLADVVNVQMTGGNNGCSAVTNQHYIDALDIFSGYEFDSFTLDGVTDRALHATVKSWGDTNAKEGNVFIVFVGGKADETLSDINKASKGFNSYNCVNIGDALYLNDTLYNQAEVAVYAAALAVGLDLKESMCNKRTIFDGIKIKRKKSEIESSIKAGTLMFSEKNGEVKIVNDKNTFTEYSEEAGEMLGYIRAVIFINTVNKDTTVSGDEYVGKQINDDMGQIVVITALKKYFEEFSKARIIKEDFVIEVDTDLQNNAKDDEFFWKWSADYNNVMKRIYGTGYIK